jgi:hypothetical protein
MGATPVAGNGSNRRRDAANDRLDRASAHGCSSMTIGPAKAHGRYGVSVSRSEKIAQILTRRASHSVALETVDARLASVGATLARLDSARIELLQGLDDEARDRLFEIGNAIRELDDELRQERAEITRLMARLGRRTLNIGVVGRARQGKSRFLQSLTELTSREIPDGKGGFCTGVPSVIQHAPNGVTRAEVFLHDESSFLAEIVRPYFEQLGLGTPPVSVREFAARLPAVPGDEPRSQSQYRHLAAYHSHYHRYGQLLTSQSPIAIGPDEIRRYVAQDSADGTEQYHFFRAVRRVVIHTPFRATAITGLGVVDLPGLGDTNLGDSKILLSALQDDVDVVLFVRMPAAIGDDIQDYDIDLYTLARDALPEIPMRLRSFLIVNRRRSQGEDNLENATRYQKKVAGSPIQVVDSSIVDCSNPDEVNAAFDPIIDYLLAHADELDNLLLTDRYRRLALLKEKLGSLVVDAGRFADLALPSSAWFPLFQELFEHTYEQLSSGLEKLVSSFERLRDEPDDELGAAVSAVIREARNDDGLPSDEDIETRIAAEGGRTIAYGKLLNEARAHLSRHFLGLDSALKTRVAWMQEQVAQVLRDTGQLGALSPATGREMLLAVADRVSQPVPPRRNSEIRYALAVLAEFELSYRGFIQHRIRPCLDGMHSDHPTYRLDDNADTVSPQVIREILQVTYGDAVSKCDAALREILTDPNGALFAIVEEFRDRVLRTIGMQREWRLFYEHVRAEIWTGRFAALSERSGQFTTWNQQLAELRAHVDTLSWPDTAGQDAQGEIA